MPLATVTVAGTLTEELPVVKAITRPPVGAAVPSVTVPVDVLPPFTVVGLIVRLVIAGGLIVNVPCIAMPLRLAVIIAEV